MNTTQNRTLHRRKWLIAGTVAGFIAVMTSVGAHAVGKHGTHGFEHFEKRFERMMNHLDVDASQRSAIRSIIDSRRNEFREFHDRMRVLRRRLHEADPGSSDYDVVTTSTAEDLARLTRQGVIALSEVRRDIWQQLTPEQRAKAQEMMKKHRRNRRHHHDSPTDGDSGRPGGPRH